MTYRYVRRICSRGLLALVLAASVGCATAGSQSESESTDPPPHDNLNATLWVQTSAEYRALARQTYAAARRQLDRALDDKSRSAALEQTDNYRTKPPAVVLDVDETVLDNSAYQARLIRKGESFSTESWNAWCRKGEAEAVPGAVEFAKYAREQGATVFYVTNREHEVEDATRANLKTLGFPLASDRDVLLTKYEKEGWEGNKVPRRRLIARHFRIALLIGDSLGDFANVPEESSAGERRAIVDEYQSRWGQSWIVLPNPMYGDWEGALYNYEYGEPLPTKRRRKRDALEGPGDS